MRHCSWQARTPAGKLHQSTAPGRQDRDGIGTDFARRYRSLAERRHRHAPTRTPAVTTRSCTLRVGGSRPPERFSPWNFTGKDQDNDTHKIWTCCAGRRVADLPGPHHRRLGGWHVDIAPNLYGNLNASDIPGTDGLSHCGPAAAVNSFVYLQNRRGPILGPAARHDLTG
jgi:hypothetical protein